MNLNLPKNWTEVTVEQFVELRSLKEEDFGSLFLYNLEVIAILSDTDADELEDLTADELNEYVTQIKWIGREPNGRIKVDGLIKKELNQLTLGEFIDLETFFADNYVTNLTKICGVLFRRFKEDEFGNRVLEPYRFNPTEREHLFTELPITNVYGIVPEYLKFRDEFMKAYENLFNPEIEEDGEMDEEDRKAEQEEQRLNKWSWERLIYDLCQGDLTKADQVTDLPLIMVFNFLSMRYELKL